MRNSLETRAQSLEVEVQAAKPRTITTAEELDALPVTRTYGHGGIKLTAYPSSGRVGIEVTAENAVMDWWELVEFVDHIRDIRIQDVPE